MILLDVSASKRFLLNVEVTPHLSHRSVARPTMRRRSGVQERMARCEDDILTDQSESVCPVRPERRSIFSQLGQWLCQNSPDSLSVTGMIPLITNTNTRFLSDPFGLDYSPPVITLPAPGDVQSRLQYTPVTDRGTDSPVHSSGTIISYMIQYSKPGFYLKVELCVKL